MEERGGGSFLFLLLIILFNFSPPFSLPYHFPYPQTAAVYGGPYVSDFDARAEYICDLCLRIRGARC